MNKENTSIFKEISKISSAFGDDLSKQLFGSLVHFSLTRNFGPVYKTLIQQGIGCDKNTIISLLHTNTGGQHDSIVLYGLDYWYTSLFYKAVRYLGIKIAGVCIANNESTPPPQLNLKIFFK